jgi:hypothetical protein
METFYEYLQRQGLLDYDASPSVLAEAKREFRKAYQKDYQRNYRKKKVRKDLYFSPQEFNRLIALARKHKKPVSKLCKELIFGYMDKRFILPDDEQVRTLELYLRGVTNNLNQLVRYIHQRKELNHDDIINLRNQVNEIEGEVSRSFRSPDDLEGFLKNIIQQNPSAIYILENFINQFNKQ